MSLNPTTWLAPVIDFVFGMVRQWWRLFIGGYMLLFLTLKMGAQLLTALVVACVSNLGQLQTVSSQGPPISSNTIAVGIAHLSVINYMFPLNEALGLMVFLVSCMLIGGTYRFVKSWVPTAS